MEEWVSYRKQRTYILMWNPAFSSYKLDNFREELDALIDRRYVEFNWSVWDWKDAEKGDKFFLVRVGKEGNTGVVMAGEFSSDPWQGEDWSGKGREVYYMDMNVFAMIDSEVCPVLTTNELMENLPGFDWTGGHSGRVLDDDLAEKLEKMWREYLHKNHEIFETKDAWVDTYIYGDLCGDL